ncbi:hypothetical protein P3X46_026057 [Hevea brasiliensis]|uniref:G-patch domain-containing protein n=1 Tax=Hevea brasiliensis TaxID=3981 RepID=A0ABQ9KWU5_HEVBR|nr:hypothetical protein P3X46_026057 [Hevea brasiliensis]
MDPRVATMMKEMKFFPGMGLGKRANGLVTFPEIKGQITRYGLGYQPTEDEEELKPTKFIREGAIAWTDDQELPHVEELEQEVSAIKLRSAWKPSTWTYTPKF